MFVFFILTNVIETKAKHQSFYNNISIQYYYAISIKETRTIPNDNNLFIFFIVNNYR